MYKKVRSTSQSATKTTNLNDPDLHLGDGVVDALYKRAMAAIKGNVQMKMQLPVRNDVQPVPVPTVSSVVQRQPVSSVVQRQPDEVQRTEPVVNSPKGSTAGQEDVVEQRMAMWTSLHSAGQVVTPKAKAKAKGKSKAKGTKTDPEDSVEKSKCCC